MRNYTELNELEQEGIRKRFNDMGFNITTYYSEEEYGMAKDGVGFMFKDLHVDD